MESSPADNIRPTTAKCNSQRGLQICSPRSAPQGPDSGVGELTNRKTGIAPSPNRYALSAARRVGRYPTLISHGSPGRSNRARKPARADQSFVSGFRDALSPVLERGIFALSFAVRPADLIPPHLRGPGRSDEGHDPEPRYGESGHHIRSRTRAERTTGDLFSFLANSSARLRSL